MDQALPSDDSTIPKLHHWLCRHRLTCQWRWDPANWNPLLDWEVSRIRCRNPVQT